MARKKKNRLEKTRVLFFRFIATFFASALSVIGLGSVIGIDLVQSAIFAGVLGLANVIESLARAYLIDGKLTMKEINYAFNHFNEEEQEEIESSSCHCSNCCPNLN